MHAQLDSLSVEKLLKEFVAAKGTGTEKPSKQTLHYPICWIIQISFLPPSSHPPSLPHHLLRLPLPEPFKFKAISLDVPSAQLNVSNEDLRSPSPTTGVRTTCKWASSFSLLVTGTVEDLLE